MNTMFVHFSDSFWLEIADTVSRRLRVSTILTAIPDAFLASRVSEQTEILRSSDFKSLQHVLDLNRDNPCALSRDDILELSRAEIVFLTITDRNMAVPMSVQHRIQYFYELIRYWLYFLDRKGIDHLFFQATPHLGYDFALYTAARKLGKKTTIFIGTDIDNILLYSDDYENLVKVDQRYHDNVPVEQLRQMMNADVLKLLNSSSFWLSKSRSINAGVLKEKEDNSLGAALQRRYSETRKSLKRIIRGAQKSSLASSLAERRLIRRVNTKVQSLYRQYHSLTEDPRASDNYVLFALHFQPERTTLPEGGVFENQLLAIDILSRALPEGWWLYVREHPRQFQKNDLRKAHFRETYYYERIKTNRNVKLISVHANQESLIHGARMIASVKGSVGWEAMTSGKPCITFARAWYSSSNACFMASSVENCREALRRALEMDKETVTGHLYRFMLFNEPRMILSAVRVEAARKSPLGYEKSVQNLADAILRIAAEA